MGDTISVIVPIYNGAEHLNRFFSTLLTQTYKDIEVICVNDGSTDESASILEKYSHDDARVNVLHQDNHGAGAARNAGLAKATGKYLSFLDCDDSFEPCMYELLYKQIVATEADICVCDAESINADTGKVNPKKRYIGWGELPPNEVFSYRDVPDRIFNIFSPVPWNKLYSAAFIKGNGLLFQEIQNTNDVCFVYSSLALADRITVIDDILIHKSVISNSISRSADKNWEASFLAYEKLKFDLTAFGRFEAVRQSYENKAIDNMIWSLHLLSPESYAKLYDMLKNSGLAALGIEEHDDDDNYYYNPLSFRRIRKILHETPERYRLSELEKCIVKRARVTRNGLRVVLECPPLNGGTYTGIAIEYNQAKANRVRGKTIRYFFPAKSIVRGDKVIVEGLIDAGGITLKETYWKVAAVSSGGEDPLLVYAASDVTVGKLVRQFFSRNYFYLGDKTVYYQLSKAFFMLVVRNREDYDGALFRLKELIAIGLSMLLSGPLVKRGIVLVHEKKCYRAADNGYAFFKYCMENDAGRHLGKDIYYVIDKRSPHYERVKQWDSRVIDYLSIKHMLYGIKCDLMVSSESNAHDYIRYPSASIVKHLILRTKHVYLKHGIYGIKKVAPASFNKRKSVMMCAVSKNEATIIHRYLGYSRSDIAITGNARFDLLTDSSTDRREILLMPTLRSHLFFSGKEDFVKSEYYQVYSRLIQSRELGAVLSKHDCTLSFYLHPTFSHHESLFSTDIENINILGDSDIQISDLLMRCSMLVTDYSSVAWDMLYMNKPILFFQFDLDLFLKTSGSYMDMRKDLPGDRCETVEELLTLIGKYAEDGLRIPDRYAKMRESFFAYTDMNNCKRIAEEIGRRRL